MVKTIIGITGLTQGSIDTTGADISDNTCVRTSDYITGDLAFVKGKFDCTAVRPKPVDGTFSGLSKEDAQRIGYPRPILKIPSGHVTRNVIDNPNYKIMYYWFFMKRYNASADDKLPYADGYVTLQIPIAGSNADGEPIRIFVYRDNNDYTYDQHSNYADDVPLNTTVTEAGSSISLGEETITYYNSGMSGDTTTKLFASYIFKSSVTTYNKDTDSMDLELVGVRDSEWAIPDVAVLGYSSNNQLVYSQRWVDGNGISSIDFSLYAPIAKFKFVLRDMYNSNFTSQCVVDKDFIEFANAWYLDENDILLNDTLIEPIDSDIFVYPFPASFWELDSSNKLETFMLPESISGDILTYPFPKSFWELDDNDKLELFMLPEPYEEKHDIVHDDIGGKEYFNQHSGAYDNALKHLNNNYRLRLEILSDEETTIGEITKDLSLTAAGQITINYEQITRRSCSLSLINVEKKYIPSKNSPFWLNRKFRLWLGLVVGKDTYWWSQGIFYTVSANATGRILSIEGVDKGGALDGTLKLNMTEAQYQFKRGKALTEMIKQTLSLDVGNPYGSKNSPIGFGGNRPIDSQPPLVGIEYYGYKTVADISIDANSYISDFFTKVAELYAADCYYNVNGNLVFEQHIDSTGYTYVPTQWEFTDLSSTYEDVNYEYSYEGENVVTVYTNATQAGLKNVAWTAYNDNPLSPINVSTGIRRASHIEIPYYNYVDEQELAQAEADLKEIQNEIKEKGIDITVTVYGNIDCNNRQLLVWDETNLERFEEAYESWGYTAEELAGTISTVMGASSEYDGVEIAYSPILQTNDGAVLLDTNTVDEYIWGLIDNAGSGWNKDTLLNLDRTGLEFDGVLIKNLIADVGTTAIKTGEAMHYVGKYGALAMAQNEVYLVLNSGQAQQIKDCRSVANHYLLTNSIIGMTLNFNTPIIPHIDVNKTIQVTDQYADIEDGIYLVQSVTIPLSGGKMAISATNINWLPNDMTFSGVSEVIENDSSSTYIGNGGGT